jgi:hypothetical protein
VWLRIFSPLFLQFTTAIADTLCVVCSSGVQLWGALMCGFTSGCFGGLVAGVFEEGEAWLTTKCPTWPQQRVFYGVFAYYFFSDPHGSMQYYLRPVLQRLGLGEVALFMSRRGSQATVILVMLILEFGLDCQGVDLLAPVNRQLSKVLSRVAPPRIDRMPVPLPPRMHRAALHGDARAGVEEIAMHEQLPGPPRASREQRTQDRLDTLPTGVASRMLQLQDANLPMHDANLPMHDATGWKSSVMRIESSHVAHHFGAS